ncbi:hypothetical protein [Candidatus Clostridium radicumherbarum]|uniref:Uncharacterized protein n=1 Tax=Candidatus Clostridium radicumherbarum TaxID=3381662 RepID=A0ABW8TNJ9_9CLOT
MIKEIISNLRNIDKNIWGLYTFKRDPLCNKITFAEKIDMIEKANKCGIEKALELRESFGSKTCREYADKLGLSVSEIEERNSNDYILFAKFNAPNKISICRNNVKIAKEMVEREKISTLIDDVNIEDVLISHEMFHFLEGQDKNIYTKNEKIKLWSIGPIKYHSGVVALGEIAAMSFAKELLKLNYYPNLFDILLLYPQNEKRALELYDEIYAVKGADDNA